MSTFAIRYKNDPDFRQKHIKYMNEKIQCPACNIQIKRAHKSQHQRTKTHQAMQKEYDQTHEKEEPKKIINKYKEDPEFKKKHDEYMWTPIECKTCNIMIIITL